MENTLPIKSPPAIAPPPRILDDHALHLSEMRAPGAKLAGGRMTDEQIDRGVDQVRGT